MKVIFIDGGHTKMNILDSNLIIGKAYEVEREDMSHYYITNERGIRHGYFKHRFESPNKLSVELI